MAKKTQSADPAVVKPVEPPPVRVGYTISAEAARLVRVAAVVTGQDHSAIIEELILGNLTGYFAGRRQGRKLEDGEGVIEP